MLKDVSWVAVACGGVFNWLFGGLWFGPLMGWWFQRIVPGAGSVIGFDLAALLGLALSLIVAAGLAIVVARTGARTLAAAIGITVVVCLCFNSTVYVAYMTANERPALQFFIAVYDLVSYALTTVVVWLVTRHLKSKKINKI